MRRSHLLLYLFSLSIFIASGCLKDPPNQVEVDRNVILQYIADNNLNATEHSSGIYYVLDDPGQGEHPTIDSEVEVKYKGSLTDGFVFDQTDRDSTVKFELNGLIPGWQIAIPLLKPGGDGTFMIPSYLAYGPSRVGPIPPNSVLIFEIELVDFQ
jgi:FKBP-type peptidyl-prolyl cis-trans isomerase FkpA